MKKTVKTNYSTYTIYDREEAVRKMAKMLVNKFKQAASAEDFKQVELSILDDVGYDSFTDTKNVRHEVSCFRDGKETVFFTQLNDRFDKRDFSVGVKDAVVKSLKLKKEDFFVYSSRTLWGNNLYASKAIVIESITIVRPCKAFSAVQKRLSALHLAPLDKRTWVYNEVFGKRGNYDITATRFFACNTPKCEKILSYLKGKKKVGYRIKEERNLDDMEYGERYETEWSGSIVSRLVFTDSKGHYEYI